jgi:hypothetical protein
MGLKVKVTLETNMLYECWSKVKFFMVFPSVQENAVTVLVNPTPVTFGFWLMF